MIKYFIAKSQCYVEIMLGDIPEGERRERVSNNVGLRAVSLVDIHLLPVLCRYTLSQVVIVINYKSASLSYIL